MGTVGFGAFCFAETHPTRVVAGFVQPAWNLLVGLARGGSGGTEVGFWGWTIVG